ncbi:MAG: alpha/beta fold hydrolase, partial [Chloroflexi bacterium]|nr:alpha/beta fold hydrolase [Chloroflexota bacterium]
IVYTYDNLYRLTNADYSTHSTSSGQTSETYAYEYDEVGNRLKQIIDGDTTTYLYDDANRLAQLNGQAVYSFDNNGNLTQSDSLTNTWDAANRLIASERDGTTVEPIYNGVNDRVGQTVGLSTTHFALDVAAGLPEVIYTSEGNAYLHLPGVIVAESSTGETRYLLSDGLGSVRQAVDETGSVVAYNEFDPYGNPVQNGSSPYGYTGEWWQAEVGLLHLRARWYSVGTGTFLSVDAVESEPAYQYVRGNPVNMVDPSGHEGFCFQGSPKSETFGPDSPIYKLCQTLAENGLLGRDIETRQASGYRRFNNDEAGKADAITKIKDSTSDRTVVIGYSWGGAAALEVAHQLDQEGVHIDDLILIDPVVDGIDYKPTNTIKGAAFLIGGIPGFLLQCDIKLGNDVRRLGRRMDSSTPSSVPPNTSRALSLYSTVRKREGNGYAPVLLYGPHNIAGATNKPIENSTHQSIMQTENVVNSDTYEHIRRFLDPPKPLQSAPPPRSIHDQILNPERPIPLQSAPEN